MKDILIEVYEELSSKHSAPISSVSGTLVSDTDVVTDDIGRRRLPIGVEASGVLIARNQALEGGCNTAEGVKTDAIDSINMHKGTPTDGVTTDGIGINSKRCEDVNGKDKKSNTSPADNLATKNDDFGKLSLRLQVFQLAEEVVDRVVIIKRSCNIYYYNAKNKICERIINKAPPDGNISKFLRDNVSSDHAKYITDAIAKGVFGWLFDRDDLSEQTENIDLEHLVAFDNGYYDLQKGCFFYSDPCLQGYYFTTRVKAKYVETPLSVLSNDFFNNVCKEKIEKVLAACGIMLSNYRELKKAFFFVGPRNSGKTTVTNFLILLIMPANAVRALSLKRLGGRFSPSVLLDAHFSWAGDIGIEEFNQATFDNFKLLTGRDYFEGEEKFRSLRREKPHCALAFSANTFPRYPLAWDYEGSGDIENGAGRNRVVIFHTRQTVTEEMINEYKRRNGMTLDKALEEDKDAIASEMIRQAGRVYRGELSFPKAAFSEVYCEGKTLKERFFYFVKTNCIKTGKATDLLPLRILIDAYKEMNPDESLPYEDNVGEERAFGSLLKYVCNLDNGFVQGKKKVNGYPNPVSCLIGCKMKTRFQQSEKPKAEKPQKNTSCQYVFFRNKVPKNW